MEPIPALPAADAIGGPTADAIVAVFEALYQAERDPMVRLALSMVDDPDRAAEIVHDAFERLYLRWGRVREPGAYLRIAVVNGCRSELRRRAVLRRQPSPRTDQATTELPDRDDELVAALRALRPRQRIAIALRFFADLPESEIADALGVRPGTVRSLISRGLAELRETLRKEPRP